MSKSFFSNMMFRLVLMSSVVMSFLTFAGVQAHELRPAVADVTVTASEVKVELLLAVEPLLAGIDLTEVMNTDDSPQAIIYDQLRSLSDANLADLIRQEWPSLSQGLLIEGGGTFRLQNIEVVPETNLDLPRDTMLTMYADLPWVMIRLHWVGLPEMVAWLCVMVLVKMLMQLSLKVES